jgi:hypothetical protein
MPMPGDGARKAVSWGRGDGAPFAKSDELKEWVARGLEELS